MTISPTDISMYLDMIGSIDTFPTRASLDRTVEPSYTEAEYFDYPADLSGYYSNQETRDLYEEVANNVAESAQALDNAIVQALENGMGVQDAVNVNLALRAYQANCSVAKSTFELKI